MRLIGKTLLSIASSFIVGILVQAVSDQPPAATAAAAAATGGGCACVCSCCAAAVKPF